MLVIYPAALGNNDESTFIANISNIGVNESYIINFSQIVNSKSSDTGGMVINQKDATCVFTSSNSSCKFIVATVNSPINSSYQITPSYVYNSDSATILSDFSINVLNDTPPIPSVKTTVFVGSGGTILSYNYLLDKYQTVNSGVLNNLNSVAYNGSVYVAVGENGIILISRDGFSWVKITNPNLSSNFYSIAYGAGRFVAVGSGVSIFSIDGFNWYIGDNAPLSALAYANNKFFGVNGNNCSYSSIGGGTWTSQCYSPASVRTYNAKAVAANLNDVVIVGDGDTGAVNRRTPVIYVSHNNGAQWGNITIDWWNPYVLNTIAYGNNAFVAFGYTEIGGAISISTNNGGSWSNYSLNASVNHMVFLNNQFVGLGGDGYIITSATGQNGSWSTTKLPTSANLSGAV